MKKVLCTIALMLLVSGSAYAQATFSLTGNYWAEGKYWFNYNAGPGTDAEYNDNSFGFYEQDINLFPKISIGNTSLNFKVVITDTYWGATQADNDTNETGVATTDNDDNIAIERAFLSHKFDNGLMLDVGLMDGTVWGTSFADDTTAQWRVKLMGMTKVGMLGAVLEKNIEQGAFGLDPDVDDWSEGEDRDSYGLFAISKVGDIYIKPLLWYVDSMKGDTGFTLFNPVLTFTGDLGGLSFESEINYKMWNAKVDAVSFDEDATTLGLYLNVWKAMDKMTPGIILAYGSYDKDYMEKVGALATTAATGQTNANAAIAAGNAAIDQAYLTDNAAIDQAYLTDNAALLATGRATVAAGTAGLAQATALAASAASFSAFGGFDFDDDFNSSIILGDEYGWGGGDDLKGMTMIKLYVNDIKTSVAPLTLFGYAEYVMSNQDDTLYEDATAYELALGANYKITDNLTYSVYGAYADIDYDVTGYDDPDSVYVIANAIEFSF